jgi:hypothetical protein
MMLIMFSLYRVPDDKARRFLQALMTGHFGHKKIQTLAVPQICGTAAVVRSNLRLSRG